MNDKMGDKQREILYFIKSEIESKGYPPSVREMAAAVNVRSTSTVHGHLKRLEELGAIRRDPTKPRAIEVLGLDKKITPGELIHVPIIGKVTAGEPMLAVENVEDYFPLSINYTGSKQLYMLKVQGDSMINAGISDNDLILVDKQNTADNGDIIVALLNDSVTVKRFFKEDNLIRLQPENDSMDPIIVEDVEILGKVRSLYRQNI